MRMRMRERERERERERRGNNSLIAGERFGSEITGKRNVKSFKRGKG
jgi:hypothetical protein